MKFEVLTVTPDMARSWLATGRTNRPVTQLLVNKYAADMRTGRWRLTKEAISFDAEGCLDDGQHRLHGVIAANAPVRMAVVWDAPLDQFEVLDSGRTRTFGQRLAIEGYRNYQEVAAATRMVIKYLKFPDVVWTGYMIVTESEMREYLDAHSIDGSDAAAARRARLLTPAAWIAINHIITTTAPSVDAWEGFRGPILSGIGLTAGDPRLALRNYATQKWGGGQSYILAGLVAWNHYVNGRTIQFIKASRAQLPMPKPE